MSIIIRSKRSGSRSGTDCGIFQTRVQEGTPIVFTNENAYYIYNTKLLWLYRRIRIDLEYDLNNNI